MARRKSARKGYGQFGAGKRGAAYGQFGGTRAKKGRRVRGR
jgi:hypothetical protein